MTQMPWSAGRWTHPPLAVEADGDDLVVSAAEGSDAWRTTAYGFVHASEHALVAPVEDGQAVEVTFTAELPEQFDQAGAFLRVDDTTWAKAGLERADGVLNLGAVVTREASDWSAGLAEDWAGRRVTVRMSRRGDAVTVRARADDEPYRLVRVFPLDPTAPAVAGPYVCAPTRAGLAVRFHAWRVTPADASLH